MADVAEPALTTLDEPDLNDMRLLPSFQDEWAPLTVESMPEDMLTSSDIFPLEDLEETMPQEPLILELDASVLPGHLTLELDRSEMTSEVSSIILDSVPLATPSGAMPAPMPTGEDQAQDEVELVLDLENVELDDDKPA